MGSSLVSSGSEVYGARLYSAHTIGKNELISISVVLPGQL